MDNIYDKKRQCCFDEHRCKKFVKEDETCTCCFFGHRKIYETEELKNNLYETIEKLIVNEKVDTFLFGSKSEFDDSCHKTVAVLKEKYPHIKRIYVKSAFQHIPDWYEDSLLNHYEGTYFPEYMGNAGRVSCVERNQEMINHSKFCVVYHNKNHLPSRGKTTDGIYLTTNPKAELQLFMTTP